MSALHIPDDWTPTAANINALPDPIRRYIHDLETRCDPAGELRELVIARQTIQAQATLIEELQATVQDTRGEGQPTGRVALPQGESGS